MKKYAVHGKNIAALLMLVALFSLLLPFCKITTPNGSATVSGIDVVKIGAKATTEYIKNGTIKNDYVVAGNLTWGDIKAGANYASKHQEVQKAVLAGVVCMLPILFCFLAMISTFIAEGKKTMFFPTLLLLAAVFENIILILGFPKLQSMVLSYAGGSTINLALLYGISVFTALCAIALVIILILWICGGFNPPEEGEGSGDNGKKDKSSGRDRRRKRGRKKKKSSKKKSKKEKRKEDPAEQPKRSDVLVGQPGILRGQSGLYQGTKVDLSRGGIVTLGTTPETMEAIRNGSAHDMEQLNGNSFEIQYDHTARQYKITNHSGLEICLMSQGTAGQSVNLGNGASATVGHNTLLAVGDRSNTIQLN